MLVSPPSVTRLDQRSVAAFRQNLSNRIVYSRLNHLSRTEMDSGLSIKMVQKGVENYRIHNTPYSLGPGSYLLVNRHQEFESSIRCRELVEGVCIYLDKNMVSDVLRSLESDHQALLDAPVDESGGVVSFFEGKYSLNDADLGPVLSWVAEKASQDPEGFDASGDELYRLIAEKLLLSQGKVHQQMDRIHSGKASTRRELFRRVMIGRDFLEGNLNRKVELQDVCRAAAMSESHFLRTFRQAFGISPYKYLLKRRLENAAEKLGHSNHSVSEVAAESGFADIFSFSKAFKKQFGVPPSKYQQSLSA